MIRLVHWSNKPLDALRSTQPTPGYKPAGLWLSDETQRESWSWFCTEEAEWPDRLAYRYEVDIDPTRLLVIHTLDELLAFTDTFTYVRTFAGTDFVSKEIAWDVVAQTYAGILITPYQWGARLGMDTFWYYGWDVASACIWDTSIIERVLFSEKATSDE